MDRSSGGQFGRLNVCAWKVHDVCRHLIYRERIIKWMGRGETSNCVTRGEWAKLDSLGPLYSRGGHGGLGGSPTKPVSLRGSGVANRGWHICLTILITYFFQSSRFLLIFLFHEHLCNILQFRRVLVL
jgi:hypothetical protein